MQRNVNARRTPIWRKIITLVLLPAIIVLWMTGWILTQIGSQGESIELRPKNVLAHHTSQANDETKIPEKDEDSNMPYNPEIIA